METVVWKNFLDYQSNPNELEDRQNIQTRTDNQLPAKQQTSNREQLAKDHNYTIKEIDR
jgi:hypothetical protein